MAIAPVTGLYVAVATSTTGGTAPGGATAPTGASLSSAVDLSAWVIQAESGVDLDELDVTTFGSGGFKAFVLGLKQGVLNITFLNDYASGGPNATLGLAGTMPPGNTTYYIEVRQTSSSRSSTNPGYLAAFKNKGWRSSNSNVGQVPQVSWSPSITGGFAELTA